MHTRTVSTAPSATFSQSVLMPARVSIVSSVLSVRPRSWTYLPTQRMALPHISEREPSALYISMQKSATSDGQISTSPSPPMPKWRSDSRIAARDGSGTVSVKQLT